ncbi:nSTAND1 domain-containing NTPase [Brunnivagina elsteri]|uniref:Uncharacterized protein n=1 Tax=Brunnivagina elsteri CCALA 953 TaxID=987040 RepID=A0A2A2THB6_9CYAN|nr:caspase family protein [Calothrix elsteri]PAX53025.1 hypothetical protein CK510_16215 [Calothrix elsteri CCALA 953]
MPRAVIRNKELNQGISTPKLWLLLVGVNQYQDQGLLSLQYPALDCQGLSEALSKATQQFPQREVITCNDFTTDLPSLLMVRTSLERITTTAKAEDTILFYFSGHGILREHSSQPYLCLRDTQIDDLINTSLPLSELLQLLSNCKACQQLVWLDACHSGGMTLRGQLNPTQQMVQVLQNAASASKGFYALLSCDTNQQSWEFPELGHGVFTYYLMRGLGGEAADAQGIITADGLYRYVYHQTLQYIDKTNQQLRLINQQRRGKGDDNLFSEYPLQTPKRIVEGVGEVVLGNISLTEAESSSRFGLVIDGMSNNQNTLRLSKIFRGMCGFELDYLRNSDTTNIRDRIQVALGLGNEATTALLYVRGRLEDAGLVIADDVFLSRDRLRQMLRGSKVSQQVIILDCYGEDKLNLQEWIEDLQGSRENGICIIAAQAVANESEIFIEALIETLESASPVVGLSAAGWITQLQVSLAGRLPIHVWLSGSHGVIEVVPGMTGGKSRKTILDLGICPYLGLKSFSEADAQYFYGREGLTQSLINHMTTASHLAVIGASGSGKSSVVQAGLVSQLRLGKQLAGSDKWLIKTIRPGVHPLQVLARKLGNTRVSEQSPLVVEGLLYEGVEGFVYWLRSRPEPMVMLVVDQFEELFTLTSEVEREGFLELLLGALRYAGDKFKLVMTLRADFIAPCLENPALANLLQTNSVLVPPRLNQDDYRSVIIQPAEQVGLQVQTGLVEVLLQELNHSVGDLPLLEFVLEQLWELRENGELTLFSYQQHLGGIAGALEKRADIVYGNLDNAAKDCAKWIFLSLTQLGEGTEDTRRRVLKSDLAVKKYPPALVERTLQALTAAKLIVMNLDEEELAGIGKGNIENSITSLPSSHVTIEVVHEILIRHWTTLKWWLEENRIRLRSQRQIEQSANLWKLHHQQADFLLQGVRLGEAEEIYVKYTDELSVDIQEFIAACLDERLRQENQQKQRLRQTQIALAVISVLGIAATGFGGFAYFQNRTAQIREINALNASSTAFLSSHQQLEGLVASIKAGKQLKRFFSPSKDIQITTAATLQQAILQTQEINRLQEHTDKVNAVSISPDSRLIASASDDGTVKIWNRAGKLITTLNSTNPNITNITSSKNYQNRVTSVIFSPDGKFIASGNTDKFINLYSIDGKLVRTFYGHNDFVTNLAFSPDSQILVSGSRDKTIKLWQVDGTKFKNLKTINAHNGWVNTVTFSPDGKFIASSGEDNLIKLWKVEDGKLIKTFTENKDRIKRIQFTHNGKSLISASSDSKIKIWNLDGKELQSFNSDKVNNINLSHDGKTLVSGSTDGSIIFWDLDDIEKNRRWTQINADNSCISLKCMVLYKAHNSQINDVAISNDGEIIVSSSDDKTVRIWNLNKWSLNKNIKKQNQTIYSIDFNPNNKDFITAGWDGTVNFWENNQQVKSFKAHESIISAIKFSHDGKIIATASADKTVKLWNAKTHQLIKNLTGHKDRITSINFTPNDQIIATGSSDKTAKLWQLSDGKLLHTLIGHTEEITSISITSDGNYIATASADNTIKIWHLNGILQRTIAAHKSLISTIAFSPDNQTLASASWDNSIKIWQVSNGKLINTLTEHSDGVTSLNFTPDSQILASASADNTIKLWNLADGTSLKTLIGYPSQINAIAFSSDTKTLVSGGETDGIMVWNLDLDNLIQQSCTKVKDYLENNRDVKQNDRNLCKK